VTKLPLDARAGAPVRAFCFLPPFDLAISLAWVTIRPTTGARPPRPPGL